MNHLVLPSRIFEAVGRKGGLQNHCWPARDRCNFAGGFYKGRRQIFSTPDSIC